MLLRHRYESSQLSLFFCAGCETVNNIHNISERTTDSGLKADVRCADVSMEESVDTDTCGVRKTETRFRFGFKMTELSKI